MRKFLLLFVFILFWVAPSHAKIITGGVEVSVNQARGELFSSSTPSPDFRLIQENLIDKNYLENYTTLLKGITEVKDRTLAIFSDGTYGVIYKNNLQNVFYYSKDGILTHNEIKTSLVYPYKAFKYSVSGELINRSLRVSEDETFIFLPNGRLYAHWIGAKCYDEDGNIVMTREILK